MGFDAVNLSNVNLFHISFISYAQNFNLIRKESNGPLKRCTYIYYLT